LRDKVIEIVSKAAKLDVSALMDNTSARLWDSITHLEIIFLLEEAFDVRLDTSDIVIMRSIDSIMEVLLRITGDK
jgi:acyl carrier protein